MDKSVWNLILHNFRHVTLFCLQTYTPKRPVKRWQSTHCWSLDTDGRQTTYVNSTFYLLFLYCDSDAPGNRCISSSLPTNFWRWLIRLLSLVSSKILQQTLRYVVDRNGSRAKIWLYAIVDNREPCFIYSRIFVSNSWIDWFTKFCSATLLTVKVFLLFCMSLI